MTDPRPLGDVVRGLLSSLGFANLDTWQRIQGDWAELAGPPWDRHARPLSLRQGVLTVEAVTPAAVSVLRYGVAGLTERLQTELGEGTVREVRVRSPERGRRGG